MKRVALVLGALLSWTNLGAQGTETLMVDIRPQSYEWILLSRALEVSDPRVQYQLQAVDAILSKERSLALLNAGKIDVVCLALNPDRERRTLPIRVDVNRGLLGYRIFLIRAADQGRFDTVHSLQDLTTRFTAGFGSQWADLAVLEANHVPLTSTIEISRITVMLEAGRFDYFPRGISEVWQDLADYQAGAPHMVVERHLGFYYPMVQCFEVAQGNTALADRIRRGLATLMADGTMRRLFLDSRRTDIQKARLEDRRIFELTNPDVPVNGPSVDRTWWLGRP